MSEAASSSSESSVDIRVIPREEQRRVARAAAVAAVEETDATVNDSSDTSHDSEEREKCVIQLLINTKSPFNNGLKIDVEVVSSDWQTVRVYTEEGVKQDQVERRPLTEARYKVESSDHKPVLLKLEIRKKPYPLQWQGPGLPLKRRKITREGPEQQEFV